MSEAITEYIVGNLEGKIASELIVFIVSMLPVQLNFFLVST